MAETMELLVAELRVELTREYDDKVDDVELETVTDATTAYETLLVETDTADELTMTPVLVSVLAMALVTTETKLAEVDRMDVELLVTP